VGTRGSTSGTIRFGTFEINPSTRELRKQGLRIRLQEQPFQVLEALIERHGELVTREDLVRRLWADGTVVDYERGLNAAVGRLRQALGDSAETPRYIETVARRGYRFLAPIEVSEAVAEPSAPAPEARPERPLRSPRILVAALASLLLAGIGAVSWSIVHGGGRRAEQSVTVIPLTIGLGAERNPSFSPDGTQVAYEWEREDGQRHIYVKVVGAGDPMPLTSGTGPDYGTAWSPDGQLIAFLRQSEPDAIGVFVVPALGGAERKLTDIATPNYWVLRRFMRRLTWTADSSRVVVSATDRRGHGEGLLSVGVSNGDQVWLTEPKSYALLGDREPAVSPDGHWVAFARGELAASEKIYVLPMTPDSRPAGPPHAIEAAGVARSPAWSPDGKAILYTGVNPSMVAGSGIWRVGIEAGAVASPVPSVGPMAGVPAVSRSGRIAYSRIKMESSIWRQNIPPRGKPADGPTDVTRASSIDGNAQYSPDGKWIAFTSSRSGSREIWTCNSEGEHCQAVTSFHANFASGSPTWSPNGRQIAFDSGAAGHMDIYTVDANGGAPKRITDDQTHGVVPNWSRDGKWIYFSSVRSGANEIWKAPGGGGDAVRVTRNGGFSVRESADGKVLYYTKAEEGADLFRSEPDGSGERLVLRGVAKRAFAVTQNAIYYVRQEADGNSTLRRFDLRSKLDEVIAHVTDQLWLGISVSPDERSVIYSRLRVTSNLMLADGAFR
jgi:Tol biopolymer transport system component/DNA-binding winged helix-turn-helix (wHTH) protein